MDPARFSLIVFLIIAVHVQAQEAIYKLHIDSMSKTAIEYVWIPPGKFDFGSPKNPYCRNIYIKGFWLSRTEVTQEQYELIMRRNPSSVHGNSLPVDRVSWHDAVLFCENLSKVTSVTITLPNEIQWEYACKAGTTTTYNFGNEISTQQANIEPSDFYLKSSRYLQDNPQSLLPVGKFKSNRFGLYDMHGNVKELCSNFSIIEFFSENGVGAYTLIDADKTKYHLGFESAGHRVVLRGGGYNSSSLNSTSYHRSFSLSTRADSAYGFRTCLVIKPPTAK